MAGNSDQLVQITAATFGGVSIAIGSTTFSYTITVDTVENKGDDDIFASAEMVVNGACEWNFDAINQELASIIPAGSTGVLAITGKRVSDGGTGIMTFGIATVKTENPTLGSREQGSYSSTGSAVVADGVTSPVVWSVT